MKKLVIDYTEYKGLVNSICRDISIKNWRPDYVVGITRGGLMPAVMISQYFNIPCHTLKIQLRDGNNDSESNLWMPEDAVEGKNILIVDDINDTGATLNWLMHDWQSSAMMYNWPKIWNSNIKFAVIVDNLASQFDAEIDYVGLEINKAENDVWIEFPYEEWWTK